ncbi:MAG: CocE/NonD family hydrolase [Gemmatimonadetes bacterium]|nr:CocE/NonD family hydrolase [Gemmatimonadota bacterium]
MSGCGTRRATRGGPGPRCPPTSGDVQAAVLNVSGWFDEPYGPAGAVTNFVKLTESRGGPAGARLILGPWQHGVDAIQGGLAGKRDFGPAAARDYAALVLDWMDAHLKRLPAAATPPVEVFVMGANRWRAFPRWPVPGLRPDTLRLAGRADARTIGALRREAGGPPSAIASDPARPLTDPFRGAYGAHDYAALAPRPGLVAFETAPFSHPVEIIGEVTAEVAVQASVPDFDLWLQLYDVAPDGTAWNLASPGTGLVRASYRNGGPAREPVPEGELVRLRMSQLYTANRFATGHRLRIVLSTAFFPLFSVNPQTGALETESAETRAGVIRIRHDAEAPSWVVLPVVPDAGRYWAAGAVIPAGPSLTSTNPPHYLAPRAPRPRPREPRSAGARWTTRPSPFRSTSTPSAAASRMPRRWRSSGWRSSRH